MELQLFESTKKGAILSECEDYRYRLWRIWDESKPKVMFIMLNPSTADADTDDPTIRRCIGFAKYWGFGGLYVGNIFAYRSTQPKGLFNPFDPVGKENVSHLLMMSQECEIAVCAWGNSPIVRKMRADHKPLENVKIPLHYIELSKDGTPKHPLYLKSELKPVKYTVPNRYI